MHTFSVPTGTGWAKGKGGGKGEHGKGGKGAVKGNGLHEGNTNGKAGENGSAGRPLASASMPLQEGDSSKTGKAKRWAKKSPA